MTVVALPAKSTHRLPTSATIDTFALPVVPASRAVWLVALSRPDKVHLAETEDGQLRTFGLSGGGAVGTATCGVVLRVSDGAIALCNSHVEVCPDCWATFLAVYARWM